jgi:diguanylate cyclase (GGDEF)-like protein/PAS domain S-box-containing protein
MYMRDVKRSSNPATRVRAAAVGRRIRQPINVNLAASTRDIGEDDAGPLESAFNHAPIGMALIDLDGRRFQVNDAFCRLTGYSRKQLIGTTVRAITHPDDVEIGDTDRQRLLRNEIRAYQVEKRYAHAWGHHIWVQVTVSLVRGRDGQPQYFISQIQDVSKRRADEKRLEELADHDSLTGLFNRRRFEEELSKEISRATRNGTPGAVLLIDLDRFKDVNDRFGHRAGDALLRTVAQALRHRVRDSDVLARLGGDEFGIILPQTDLAQAQLAADGIVHTLRRHTAMLGNDLIHTSASVGLMPFDGLNMSQILECVDLAMYEAKEAGRNRFAVHRTDPHPLTSAPVRPNELDRVRQSLEAERLQLYCQPIVDLADPSVRQFELLLRLETEPGAEPLLPSAFLHVAERFGLVQKIDTWVVEHAIALIAANGRSSRPLILDVNVSAKSIGDPRFAAATEAAIARAGINPQHLVFEITETAAIADIEEATRFITRLRKVGCRFALDDFGTGFGSFYYLKYLPFDILKIDGDFIRNFGAGHIDQLVVGAIVGIAKGLGKKTVAEFVETADLTRLLRNSGVDYAQGYYLGRPRPVADVLTIH